MVQGGLLRARVPLLHLYVVGSAVGRGDFILAPFSYQNLLECLYAICLQKS